MELIIAIFILAGWYVFKYTQKQKKAVEVSSSSRPVDVAPQVSEVKVGKRTAVTLSSCDFCQGEDIFIAGTKEKIPCPKCRRGMKISV